MRHTLTFTLCALFLVSPALAAPSTTATTAVASDAVKVATPARPGDSCGWSARLEDDEEGQVMVASSCDSDAESGPAFRLLCGDGIILRYNGLGLGDNPPASSTLVLTAGDKSVNADVVFEEMDGAYAAYFETGNPAIALLKTNSAVGVTLKGTNLPPRTVSLKGSTAAIDKLIKACE